MSAVCTPLSQEVMEEFMPEEAHHRQTKHRISPQVPPYEVKRKSLNMLDRKINYQLKKKTEVNTP